MLLLDTSTVTTIFSAWWPQRGRRMTGSALQTLDVSLRLLNKNLIRYRDRAILTPFWKPLGTLLGPFWETFGQNLETFWQHFWQVVLASIFDAFSMRLNLVFLILVEAKMHFSHFRQGRCWHRFWLPKPSQNGPKTIPRRSQKDPKGFSKSL